MWWRIMTNHNEDHRIEFSWKKKNWFVIFVKDSGARMRFRWCPSKEFLWYERCQIWFGLPVLWSLSSLSSFTQNFFLSVWKKTQVFLEMLDNVHAKHVSFVTTVESHFQLLLPSLSTFQADLQAQARLFDDREKLDWCSSPVVNAFISWHCHRSIDSWSSLLLERNTYQ